MVKTPIRRWKNKMKKYRKINLVMITIRWINNIIKDDKIMSELANLINYDLSIYLREWWVIIL